MTAMKKTCGSLTLLLGIVLALSACHKATPEALGTLEYDRISLPATAAERIVAMNVHEGQAVHAGQTLLQLDPALLQARLTAAQAQARQQQELLAELKAGPRSEDIAKARANLAAAEANARETRKYYERILPLAQGNIDTAAAAPADIDRAHAAAEQADGRVRADRAALEELLQGTRREQIAQGEAASTAAAAQANVLRIQLGKLQIVAPRSGWIDALPYKLGDQPPVGAPLAIVLVGDVPYARIYISEPQRPDVQVGDMVRVLVGHQEKSYEGKIRMLHAQPSFTPYYALIGDDATHLSYLAEVSLGKDAAGLPAGVPVRVTFDRSKP